MLLSILGIIGATGIASSYVWARQLLLSRRFMRFSGSEPLDIVVATSDVGKGGPDKDEYLRPTVSASNVEAAVLVATASGALRQRKDLRVWLSETSRVSLDGDLVIIGGQLKNRVAGDYLSKFNELHGDLAIERHHDKHRCSLSVGQWTRSIELENEPGTENPVRDLVLVVFSRNWLTIKRRRGVLCAGFTSHGSISGVRFAFEGQWKWRGARGGHPLHYLGRKWPSFIAVLAVDIKNGIPTTSEVLLWKEIP